MEKLYNLTGKKVTFSVKGRDDLVLEPEKFVAKEVREEINWTDTDGVPTVRWLWHVSGLPIPQDDIVYVVTPMVLSVAALMGRTTKDLRCPAAGIPGKEGVYRTLITL